MKSSRLALCLAVLLCFAAAQDRTKIEEGERGKADADESEAGRIEEEREREVEREREEEREKEEEEEERDTDTDGGGARREEEEGGSTRSRKRPTQRAGFTEEEKAAGERFLKGKMDREKMDELRKQLKNNPEKLQELLKEKEDLARKKQEAVSSMKSGRKMKVDMKEKLKGRPIRTCDLSNLPDSVPDVVKQKVQTIVGEEDASTKIEAAIDIVNDLDPVCFKQLSRKLSGLTATVDQAKRGVCNAKGDKVKIMSFAKLVPQDDICAAVTAILEDFECEESHIKFLRDARVEFCGAEDMPVEDIFTQDPRLLQNLFEKADADGKKAILRKLVNYTQEEPEILTNLPCHSVKFFTQLALDNLVPETSEPANHDDFWSEMSVFLPFLPGELCEALTVDKISGNIDLIKDLDFKCSKNDEKREKMREVKERAKKLAVARDAGAGKKFRDPKAVRKERLSKAAKHSGKCFFQCGKIIIKKVMKDIKARGEVSGLTPESLKKLKECQSFEDALMDVSPGQCHSFDAERLKSTGLAQKATSMMDLKKRCMPQKALGDLTLDDLKSLGCLAILEAKSKNISIDIFCEPTYMEETLKPCMDVMGKFRGMVMKKCSTKLKLNKEKLSETLEAVGEAFVELPTDQLVAAFSNVTLSANQTETLAAGLEQVSEGEQRLLAIAVAENAETEDLLSHEQLAKYIPYEDFEAVLEESSATDIIEGSDTTAFKDSQASMVVEQYMEEEEKASGSDLTEQDAEYLGNLVQQIPSDTLAEVEELPTLMELCKQGVLDGTKVDTIAEGLTYGMVDVNSVDPIDVLSVDDIYEMQPECFKLLTEEHLATASRDLRHAVCNMVGSHPRLACAFDSDARQLFARVCVDKTDVDEGDTVYNFVENNGHLLAHVNLNILDGVSGGDLLKVASKLQPVACIKKTHRDLIIQKLAAAVSLANLTDEDNLIALGDLAYFLHNEIDADLAFKLATYVIPEHLKDSEDFAANLQCCKAEMTDEEAQDAADYLTQAAEFQLKTLSASVPEPEEVPVEAEEKRKRRETSEEVTCTQVSDMDKSVLTAAQITSMTDDDFQSCFDTGEFGAFEGFTDAVETAILNRILDLKSQTACELESADVENLGAVADKLTEANIACLNLGTTSLLGQYSKYTPAQLQAFAARYLDVLGVTASGLTQQNVVAMQHFACGLSATEIASIPNEVYGSASAVIGGLKLCPQDALSAWASKAIAVFGEVDTWSPAQFAEAGLLIGGLTADQLNTAGTDDVEMWSTHGISVIPSDVFKDIDGSLLLGMSNEQVRSIQADQLSAVDASVQEELEEIQTETEEVAEEIQNQAEEEEEGGGLTTTPADPTTKKDEGSSGIALSSIINLVLVSSLFTLLLQ